ncbi:Bgt-4167 [Blumeria graminis f. sp. tritici]|uniref:Bgt-4167 n=2 Tax=Blumeria graminis f. sp. tritici TaxID=62690 RepID=A0A381LF38_BLUGR|nr:hypothetical protein BGT96224_4167 [Blumeria graminis f. sp. tritici 96224]VDB89067.1 Bgt-4167 [Blumeria graminis f. sp. tritici]
MSQLSPSAIFSPSAAKKQLAVAKDWNYVDDWLSSKFKGRSPPLFERNSDTLKVLLALAAFNESADEENDLIASVEAKVLHDLDDSENQFQTGHNYLALLEDSMTREGQKSLETLSNLSVTLNQSIPDIERLGRSLIDLQVTLNVQEQTEERINTLEAKINAEIKSVNSLIVDLQSETYTSAVDSKEHALDYHREIKSLKAKLPELRERVASLSASFEPSIVTTDHVKADEAKFEELLNVVREIESKANSFHGLPQDIDLARSELEAMRENLFKLTRQRDAMFENLVEMASPKKA